MPGGQRVRMPVRPAHAAAGAADGELRPLHVAEILVVERLRQGAVMILEGVDRAVLAVEKGRVRR